MPISSAYKILIKVGGTIIAFFCILTTSHSSNGFSRPKMGGLFRTLRSPPMGDRHTDSITGWFVGIYDNRKQSSRDTAKGKPTARDGGHEHVIASIRPHPLHTDVLISSYYLNSTSQAPFRFRYYQLLKSDDGVYDATMKLFKPKESLASQLKTADYALDYSEPPLLSEFEEITGGDIGWRRSKHIKTWLRGDHYHGSLVNGTCTTTSQLNPNMTITIKDDLHLWRNELWINDRVYGPNGELLIGNIFNIPYKLKKRMP